jgi:hypothetical protein
MIRRAGRVGLAFGVTCVALLVAATPAGAHTTSGPPASDYRSTVTGVVPAAPGVHAGHASDGDRIELRVDGPARVTVLGYQGEPYLRVSRDGVFENRSSPAVALNRTRTPSGPAQQGPIRAPRWVRVSDGSTAVWHDHRAHWMGGATPEVVRRDTSRGHIIERWRIPLRVDGRLAAVTGAIHWDPPPATVAWVGLALALAVVLLVAARVATRPVLLAALALLAVAEALHLWGSWPFSTATTIGRVGENIPSIAAVLVCLFALGWLASRSVYRAAPVVVLAGLFAAVAGGLADLPTLLHAWVPSRFAPGVARTLVAVALGVGTGVAIAGFARLRAPRPSS